MFKFQQLGNTGQCPARLTSASGSDSAPSGSGVCGKKAVRHSGPRRRVVGCCDGAAGYLEQVSSAHGTGAPGVPPSGEPAVPFTASGGRRRRGGD